MRPNIKPWTRLDEAGRTSRRTIADALEVMRQHLGANEILRAQIQIGPLELPSGKRTALVDVVFTRMRCRVSLPTSARFTALRETGSRREEFEISRLDRAKVCSDGSVKLADGTKLRAVEVVPSHLPYSPSQLDLRILRHVIEFTKSHDVYRSIREGLPEHLQDQVPDVRALDYRRLPTIPPRLLKKIRAFIEDNDPELKFSDQKIADALATSGVRTPKRRPRVASAPDPTRC